jgi:diketogulonate reductase-like aldo/keto reductase
MEDGVISTAGVKMPKILYGTAWKKERTDALVMQAVLAGFRGIDTACQPRHYEEPLVGLALQQLQAAGIGREALFLQTKFTPPEGQDPGRTPYDRNAPVAEQVAQSFEASQRNLQTEYVDSLVLHSPPFPYRNLLATWRAMEAIFEGGGARQLGISNCYDLGWLQRLCGDARIKPAVVQNHFCADSGYDAALRAWCREHGIIYQSFWTLTANPHILGSRTVLQLAQRYGKTPAQLFFGYLGRMGIVPLTGTTSERHMYEDLESFDTPLTPEETARIGRLLE